MSGAVSGAGMAVAARPDGLAARRGGRAVGRGGRTVGLTRNGVTVAVGAALCLGGGLALGYPTLSGLGAAGLGALLIAAALVHIPAPLAVTRVVRPERVTVGAGATGHIEVRNGGRLPTGRFEAVDLIDGEPIRVEVPPLPRGGTVAMAYPVATPRRGVVTVGPVRLERADPLGLVRRAERLAAPARLWVRPRVHPARPLPVGLVLDFEGRFADRAQRGSTAFASLREYQVGDDPRQIHWRSTARVGTLVVQERVDTTEPTTTVILDTRAELLDPPTFEEAVEVAASVVVATERAGHLVTLAMPGEDPAAVVRDGGRGPLDRLAAVGRIADADVRGVLALAHRAPAGGSLVVVTGAEPAVVARLSTERRRFGRVVVVQLTGAMSSTGPAGSGAAPGRTGSGPAITGRAGLTVIRAGNAVDAVEAYRRLAGGQR